MTADERKLAELLENAVKQYQKLNARQQRRVLRAVDGTRLDLSDLLNDLANSDGKIDRRRLMRALRELRAIEEKIDEVSLREIEDVIDETVRFGIDETTAALAAVIGVTVARRVKKRKTRKDTVAAVGRPREDGLRLRDRTVVLAGDYNDRLASVIRSGIVRGESVSAIMRSAKQVYDGESWKLRSIVVTEGNVALRRTTGEIAKQSDVVKALRLHDGVGGHKYHEKHECYIWSNEDRYGLGKGVFRLEDDFIFNPHPNCTSYVTYVLKGSED